MYLGTCLVSIFKSGYYIQKFPIRTSSARKSATHCGEFHSKFTKRWRTLCSIYVRSQNPLALWKWRQRFSSFLSARAQWAVTHFGRRRSSRQRERTNAAFHICALALDASLLSLELERQGGRLFLKANIADCCYMVVCADERQNAA